MAHYRKKHPTKVQGNKCVMCQGEKMMGNAATKWWGSEHRYQPPKNIRKRPDLARMGWEDAA